MGSVSLSPVLRTLLALCLCLSASSPPDAAAVARLESEVLRLRTMRFVLEDKRIDPLLERIADARLEVELDPKLVKRAALPLLDLIGAYLTAQDTPGRTTAEERIVDAALEALRPKLTSEVAKWMASEVLAVQSVPIERRRAVARLFRDRPAPVAKLALALSARDADAELAVLSLAALAGWNDDLVHATFLEQLEALPLDAAVTNDRLVRLTQVERHFQAVRLTTGSRAAARLAALARGHLLAADWRNASRAIAWSHALDDKDSIPFLLAALDAWTERGARGLQALRVRHELTRALEARSGQDLGLEPAQWKAWWQAVSDGLRPAPTQRPEGTRAAFFGVKPDSDRIVFVLDRSGSMGAQFAPGSARRWDEATKQLYAFLAASPEALRYNVVVFHDFAESFREHTAGLATNNHKSLEELKLWLSIHSPGGATLLRSGIEKGLGFELSSPRTQPAAKIECDTLILLCDGETSEGAAWVPRFLATDAAELRLAIHGVQVGGLSDGVLEELAKGTRGGFVKVGLSSEK